MTDATVTATNIGEVDLPTVEVTDLMLENLAAGTPPGINIVCTKLNRCQHRNELRIFVQRNTVFIRQLKDPACNFTLPFSSNARRTDTGVF